MGETHDQVDRGTARLATWALWLGIGGLVPLLIPVALVVAVVVLVRARRPGLAPPTVIGNAVVGVVLALAWGGVWTTGVVLVANSGEVQACEQPLAGYANTCTLKVGDCIAHLTLATREQPMRLAPCTEPHNAQVVGGYRDEDREWPGDTNALTPKAKERCPAIMAGSTDVSALSETDELLFLGPDWTSWERGHRNVHCIVFNDTGTWHRSLLR